MGGAGFFKSTSLHNFTAAPSVPLIRYTENRGGVGLAAKHRTCTCAQSNIAPRQQQQQICKIKEGEPKKKKRVRQLSGRSVPTVQRLGVGDARRIEEGN